MRNKWLDTFLQESEELLAGIEESALVLGSEEATDETVNQIFRAFHTIKGSGSMCGLTKVAEFTHHVETLLDKVRSGSAQVSKELVEVVLAASDHLRVMLAAEHAGEGADATAGAALVARIEGMLNAGASPRAVGPKVEGAPALPADAGETRMWHIRFRPDPGLLACGGNPVLLLRDLGQLGSCEVKADISHVPLLNELQTSQWHVAWDVVLCTGADENAIRDVFLFVEDGSELEIKPLDQACPKATEAAQSALAEARPHPKGNSEPQIGEQPKTVNRESTVRVPSSRLDRLVNLVGELVMNQSRLSDVTSRHPELAGPVQEMERLVAELRDDVLGIRMLPIGTIFGRFRRLVHDLSADLGKEADLITEGAETELDKSILDQLGEPLVHLLRNCLDHGIELPEERLAQGKPRRGTVRLSASHVGSDVVIRIVDDGRGINRSAVRAKAVERQLISPEANLSDRDLLGLILLPGFSTARQVTSVSGRGVGMDVVKKQIDALRGALSIQSEEGKGTTMSLNLPLTLAIIEGLIVQIGRDHFILPMASVMENVELTRAQRERNNRRNVVAVRGELVPYIDLRAMFGICGESPAVEKIVIVQHEGQRVGLVVDRVLGSHQTVLQSLGKFFRKVDVVSGATIMGDGRVALIMDISAVVRFADNRRTANESALCGELISRPTIASQASQSRH